MMADQTADALKEARKWTEPEKWDRCEWWPSTENVKALLDSIHRLRALARFAMLHKAGCADPLTPSECTCGLVKARNACAEAGDLEA